MSSEQKSDAHGGYFVGHPTNHAAEKTEEPPHAAGEQNPVTAQTPGDYFVGRPESHHKQQQAAVPQQTTKQSTPSFLAKCCPCLAGGGAAE
ncbi:uncharacterized protein [Miscanthus floridulus]|uniref:uncharacterized protein n=1 Tax=Miscanthus floridulus TaxID=154761 RepID=UPI00345804B7